MATARPLTILIIRAYSPANIGDGAIVLAMVAEAQRVFGPDTHVSLSAADPDLFRSLMGLDAHHPPLRWGRMGSVWPRIAWVFRSAPSLLAVYRATGGGRARLERALEAGHLAPESRQALRAYAQADIVLASGGGYLSDEYRLQYPAIHVEYRAARAAGVPLVFFSQSFGPADRWFSRAFMLRALGIASAFIARDECSARRVRGLGLAEERLHVCPDVAFLAVPPLDASRQAGLLGVALVGRDAYPGSEERRHNAYVDAAFDTIVAHLRRDRVNRVRLYCASKAMGSNTMDDISTAREMLDRLGDSGYEDRATLAPWTHDPVRFATDVAACELLVASRTHVALLALAQGVPVVGVGYQEKMRGLLDHFDLGAWTLSLDAPRALPEMSERAWSERSELAEIVRAKLPDIRLRASRAMEYCAEVLAVPPA